MRYAFLSICLALPAADWTSWRGGSQMGQSGDPTLTAWTEKNILWRTPLPESGNSTPIVVGNKVFVTQARRAAGQRLLLCFDRAAGKQLWQAAVSYPDPEPTHDTNPYASASPVSDGNIVVVWFGSAGLHAYDLNGKQLWRRDLGVQKHTWGYGTSPVIHGDKVFLNFGPGERSFFIAVNKADGATLWRHEIPPGQGKPFANWVPADMYGSWATPVVIRTPAREEVLLSLPGRISSYDPASGKLFWTCRGLGDLVYPSPIYADGVIFAASGFSGPALAVKPGGEGDVTASHRLWHRERGRQWIGSGVITGGRIITIDTGGIAEAMDLKTGKVEWTARMAGKEGAGAVWSSPVLNGGKLYVFSQTGELFIADAATGKVEHARSVDERSNSSVAISNGDIFLRTHAALYRLH
ncbi:MAG: PQQ-binding-like beta-propeller repeat protein [Bryobacteraceae bacterium]